MAYHHTVIQTTAEIVPNVKKFLALNTTQGWELVDDTDGPDAIFSVRNVSHQIAIRFTFGLYSSQVTVGTDANGTAISEAHSTSTGDPFPSQVPGKLHLIMTPEHFILVLERLSDHRCFPRGGGIGIDSDPDLSDRKIIWASGPAEHWNRWPIQFLTQNFGSTCAWVRNSAGNWFEFGNYSTGNHVPWAVDSSADRSGTYDFRLAGRLTFPLSGTTIFLPCLLCGSVDIGGAAPRWDLTSVRACSTRLSGNGDIKSYQGEKWIIFSITPWNYNPTDGRRYIGYAFKLEPGDHR